MEWLAIDMTVLAQNIFRSALFARWGTSILSLIQDLSGVGVTRRLTWIGAAIAEVAPYPHHQIYAQLSQHRSDVVRQWAAYALNALTSVDFQQRLTLTRPFATDRNMSVRECAWMAFRPHLARELSAGLNMLKPYTRDSDPNIRRFAIEVTRPRSVWGEHIGALKQSPQLGLPLLQPLKSDPSLYVRTAVANWLNDAWKSSPAWVEAVCSRWNKNAGKLTLWIIRRALRSKHRSAVVG
jgi:3-methyladenine DNA glycosylase AlkC